MLWKARNSIALLSASLLMLTSCSASYTIQMSDLDTQQTEQALPDLDTQRAGQAILRLTNGTATIEDLDACPIDQGGRLLDEAIESVDIPDAFRGERSALLSSRGIFESDIGRAQPHVACLRHGFTEVYPTIGFYAAAAPDDFDLHVRIVAGLDEGSEIAWLGSREHLGGQLTRVCVAPSNASSSTWCEVGWYNDDVHVALFVTGFVNEDPDVDSIESGLVGALDRIVMNLSEI